MLLDRLKLASCTSGKHGGRRSPSCRVVVHAAHCGVNGRLRVRTVYGGVIAEP
ncbi:MAG: hypothetical protein N2512_12870 [Armatimonadetes bacterium]|nr:hypothetical protein [Armatimonadota bacterium]